MKLGNLNVAAFCVAMLFGASVYGQKRPAKPVPKPRPIIFAVLNDGKSVEPIALIEAGKLVPATGGDGGESDLTAFARNYYRPKARYELVFGGASAGSVQIIKKESGECAGNSSEVLTTAATAKMKGYVMAIATNAAIKKDAKRYRRVATPAERSEIDALARSEFAGKGVGREALRQMKYLNLTALDVDRDGVPEFVGSYWVAPAAGERRTLFVIAEKVSGGKYQLVHSEYEEYDKDKVMSGEVKDLDDGIYHNLLLDVFDYDGNGVSEIFTTAQAFEGRNFSGYQKDAGKWSKVLESYNYRCGY